MLATQPEEKEVDDDVYEVCAVFTGQKVDKESHLRYRVLSECIQIHELLQEIARG